VVGFSASGFSLTRTMVSSAVNSSTPPVAATAQLSCPAATMREKVKPISTRGISSMSALIAEARPR